VKLKARSLKRRAKCTYISKVSIYNQINKFYIIYSYIKKKKEVYISRIDRKYQKKETNKGIRVM